MADTAPQIQYRQEYIAEYERTMSSLRQTTVTEAVIKGNQATFLVAGSGDASATTRGVNGLIPARSDSNTQTTATLVEWHDLVRKTRFNIFQSQGDQRRLMQETSTGTLNRKLDDDIITQLDTATTNLGAATTMSLSVCAKALATLGENNVPIDDQDNLWAVATPSVMAYMMQLTEFASHDYVEVKPLAGPARKTLRWGYFNWIFHTGLTGMGTSSEKCYFYHRNAIGSAFDTEGLNTAIGYEDEQDYSYARASSFIGSKLLQQNGIVQFLHDASAI